MSYAAVPSDLVMIVQAGEVVTQSSTIGFPWMELLSPPS